MATGLYLDYSGNEYVTREGDRNDQWDRDDTCTDWTFNSLHLSDDENRYAHCYIDGEAKVGDTLYIVYAVYSTGDSFGHDDRASVEVFTAHRVKEVAEFNYRLLEASRHGGGSVSLALDDGKFLNTYLPWSGYFESLDDVYMTEFEIER
jgi:hypothetical protein